MKSRVEMSEALMQRFDSYIQNHDVSNAMKPTKFIHTCKTHFNIIELHKLNEEGYIPKRNPLMCVLGDSVSCGHFEMIDSNQFIIAHDPSSSYCEKLRLALQEKYPCTAITLINSAIAGDNIVNMEKRLNRDVICHQPDLVIINATLNWSENRGTFDDFKNAYHRVVKKILSNTNSEILLLTPNITSYEEDLKKRIEVVKELASMYNLPLVDLHRMFTDVLEPNEYIDVLSNKENHPTIMGHTYMAKMIMKVFEDE